MLTRRSFVGLVAGLSVSMLPVLGAGNKIRRSEMKKQKELIEEEVTPAEDLMREHGHEGFHFVAT